MKADINSWMPALKPNGIMAGHDFDRALLYFDGGQSDMELLSLVDTASDNRHYGVYRAVVESFSQFDMAEDADSTIWHVRPQWKK